ncbi:DNA repair protein complementing XP-A cells homolog [Hydra vulgaris]|uniref:DNA repair protein complementing XP-A cells homolog n=1 Tax=Hydra vulgaris TaxID=6087 RepID=G8H6N8_HYDVU|nr:DNA repair protein complementing XP-A cells homolog [Hydra vulgaris]AER00322.1 xeroderma pigmentosum group A [Hydra vulgaris]
MDDKVSAAQKARIEKNRQRALLLRSARLTNHPYTKNNSEGITVVVNGSRLIDSGAGFLMEPEDDNNIQCNTIIQEPAPYLLDSQDLCRECHAKFSDSFMLKNFNLNVCDGCRDKDKHKLITKTDAKQKYCLKDCDFDVREPPLKFILKKNPHNDRWGDMKLFLEDQVRNRAIEVWGSEDGIEEQKELRTENKDKLKNKKFEKKIKNLRDTVRTSTWHKDLSKHTHEYDSENEVYHEDEDVYEKKCKTCDYKLKYEKM